jgi:Zn-dependent protease
MQLRFSVTEIKDILLSTLVLAIAFTGYNLAFSSPPAWLIAVGVNFILLAIVFLSHEILGHKLVAQRFGAWAEYRKWDFGLLLCLITSMFGFIFAAPGAVYIGPVVEQKFAFRVVHLGHKEYGKIALAGPAVNIILGFVFLLLWKFLLPFDFIQTIAMFSLFLALFNLLPFGPLDGQKVMAWNKKFWAVAIAMAGGGYILLSML